jgi:ATP-dependent Clp protease protease subunit
VLIHQPEVGGLGGQAVDIEIHAKEILRMRALLDQILATHSGQTLEKVSRDTDRDFIMNSEQALAYGIIDQIITAREQSDVLAEQLEEVTA